VDQARTRGVPDRARSAPAGQQIDRAHPQTLGQPLHRLERDIPLPPLQATDVGAVHPDGIGQLLLAEAVGQAVGSEVTAELSLEVPGHPGNCGRLLLGVLQTDE